MHTWLSEIEREAEEARAELEARRRQTRNLMDRLGADGYEVTVARCPVTGRFEAVATRAGAQAMVGYGFGPTILEALLSLMGDLGYEVRL